ncbi:MAG: SURF1 family protein [Burkholderiales bacterium]|nr:SURF1 family protein [Burkholderiales bacterium]
MTRKFRPSLIPTLAAGLAVAATVSLGNWQQGRAAEKLAVQSQLQERQVLGPQWVRGDEGNTEPLTFRRVVARGQFETDRQIFLDNKNQGNRVGVHLLTPFRLESTGRVILVNRGWLARPREYPNMPVIPAPSEKVEVAGLAVPPIRRFVELSDNTVQGALWQNLTIDRAAAHLREPVFPLILLSNVPAPGLAAVSERPDLGIEKHQGYAFQWYALASLVVVLWLGLNFRTVKPT